MGSVPTCNFITAITIYTFICSCLSAAVCGGIIYFINPTNATLRAARRDVLIFERTVFAPYVWGCYFFSGILIFFVVVETMRGWMLQRPVKVRIPSFSLNWTTIFPIVMDWDRGFRIPKQFGLSIIYGIIYAVIVGSLACLCLYGYEINSSTSTVYEWKRHSLTVAAAISTALGALLFTPIIIMATGQQCLLSQESWEHWDQLESGKAKSIVSYGNSTDLNATIYGESHYKQNDSQKPTSSDNSPVCNSPFADPDSCSRIHINNFDFNQPATFEECARCPPEQEMQQRSDQGSLQQTGRLDSQNSQRDRGNYQTLQMSGFDQNSNSKSGMIVAQPPSQILGFDQNSSTRTGAVTGQPIQRRKQKQFEEERGFDNVSGEQFNTAASRSRGYVSAPVQGPHYDEYQDVYVDDRIELADRLRTKQKEMDEIENLYNEPRRRSKDSEYTGRSGGSSYEKSQQSGFGGSQVSNQLQIRPTDVRRAVHFDDPEDEYEDRMRRIREREEEAQWGNYKQSYDHERDYGRE